MKKFIGVVFTLAVLWSSPVFAELYLVDAAGKTLGILVSTTERLYFTDNNTTIASNQGRRHIVYDPGKKYIFELYPINSGTPGNPPSTTVDIGAPGAVYYSGANCTGTMYAYSFEALQNGLVKVSSKYYRTTPNAGTITLKSYATFNQNDNIAGCVNYTTPRVTRESLSQLLQIPKPYAFIPAKLPLHIEVK